MIARLWALVMSVKLKWIGGLIRSRMIGSIGGLVRFNFRQIAPISGQPFTFSCPQLLLQAFELPLPNAAIGVFHFYYLIAGHVFEGIFRDRALDRPVCVSNAREVKRRKSAGIKVCNKIIHGLRIAQIHPFFKRFHAQAFCHSPVARVLS